MYLFRYQIQSYPLGDEDQLIHAKVQEHLGQLALDGTNNDLAEKWYKKSLRTIMDLDEAEEKLPFHMDLQNLKCMNFTQNLLNNSVNT